MGESFVPDDHVSIGPPADLFAPARWESIPMWALQIVVTVLFAMMACAVAFWRPGEVGVILAVTMGCQACQMLLAGGYVQVDNMGVEARNVLLRHRFTWAQIERFDATMTVDVITYDGQRTSLWAVQRANIAAMTGARSQVDDVVDALEKRRIAHFRAHAGQSPPDTTSHQRSIVRPRGREIAQLAIVMPAAALTGLLLGTL